MGILSIFQGGAKYFDKSITAKCDYCQWGKRAKDGNKIICEKKGLVDPNYSCGKFIYSPLKRIPVKQLNFVGSLADEDLYFESVGERAEKEGEKKAEEAKAKAAEEAKAAEVKAAEVEKSAVEAIPAEEKPEEPAAESESSEE